MLGSAEATAYDLRFRLLRVPVRVHPFFWLVMLMLSGHGDTDTRAALVFVVCAFVSILVHEFGHGLAGRLVGDEPLEIVLHAMGGYCAFSQTRATRWRRIFLLLCGPGAGFLLFGLVIAYSLASGPPESALVELAVRDLLFINLCWGVLNLLPLWPLDGGQILSVVLEMISPRHGMRWSHVVGLLTAAGLAIWLVSIQDYWMAVWFGYFGFINYQRLQALHHAYMPSDEQERWRR